MKERDKAMEQEAAMRECTEKIFWYKLSELPLALLTVGGVRLVTNPRHYRYGGWPLALGSGVLALGMMEMATFYAWKRCCVEKVSKGGARDKVERPQSVGYRTAELEVTETERSIYEDCKSQSIWRYSLPLMSLGGGLSLAAVRRGYLSPSRLVKAVPSGPKVVVGAGLGYVLGQVLYMSTGDCMERFEKFAPEGDVYKEMKRLKTQLGQRRQNTDSGPPEVSNPDSVPEVREEEGGYVLPADSLKDVDIDCSDDTKK